MDVVPRTLPINDSDKSVNKSRAVEGDLTSVAASDLPANHSSGSIPVLTKRSRLLEPDALQEENMFEAAASSQAVIDVLSDSSTDSDPGDTSPAPPSMQDVNGGRHTVEGFLKSLQLERHAPLFEELQLRSQHDLEVLARNVSKEISRKDIWSELASRGMPLTDWLVLAEGLCSLRFGV